MLIALVFSKRNCQSLLLSQLTLCRMQIFQVLLNSNSFRQGPHHIFNVGKAVDRKGFSFVLLKPLIQHLMATDLIC